MTGRYKAWRNLMVGAINAGLEQQMFGLRPGENWKVDIHSGLFNALVLDW